MNPMKTERKTPRTDRAIREEETEPSVWPVDAKLARALEIETQELSEALEEVSDELATFGMFSESNASSDPVVKARAIIARHRANQEVNP